MAMAIVEESNLDSPEVNLDLRLETKPRECVARGGICRHAARHDHPTSFLATTPLISHLTTDFVMLRGKEASGGTMHKCSLALTSPRLPPGGRRAWIPVALGIEELAALTSAAPPWGGRACNPLEHRWGSISARTLDKKPRPEGEERPPDYLERHLVDRILIASATRRIGEKARRKGSCPEGSCYGDFVGRAQKKGVQGGDRVDYMNYLDLEGMKGDPSVHNNKGERATTKDGETRGIKDQINVIAAYIDQETSASMGYLVTLNLAEARPGGNTEPWKVTRRTASFIGKGIFKWACGTNDIPHIAMKLQDIGASCSVPTMDDCGNRPMGNGDFPRRTTPELGNKGYESRMQRPRGLRDRSWAMNMKGGDMSRVTIVHNGAYWGTKWKCTTATMVVNADCFRASCIAAPLAAREAQGPQ